jgi:uncharacterized membrane protein
MKVLIGTMVKINYRINVFDSMLYKCILLFGTIITIMKLIYLIIFVSSLILAAISGCISTTNPSEKAQYTDVSVQQAKEMIDSGDVSREWFREN